MTWRRASESTRLFPPPRLMSHSRILIVRHGETNENVQGIVQGQLDTMLNEIGYEQAHKTGMALRHEPLSRIITSPLKRTLHTAEAIASFHPGIQVELDARLKERYFGEIEGRAFESPAHWPAHAEGMEPRDQLRDRLASMWEDLKRDAQASPSIIVLVSHGGAISSLIHHVIVRSGDAVFAPSITPHRCWNCSISDIHLPADAPGVIVRWADVSHLEDAAHKVVNVDENFTA
ncbi:uncharacterized protein DNF11_1921 [Malassezia restricta CBS 7877]|uniref:Uncharacterized protein n=1 Tax=Malassezia restricta (strain ATCC 96810 / NBRC 103918 / CBS 7877) TaxID=425264 RepID=A0A3G2S462_MALR7|nr:uncharacterized protein DNF11_1921 [Malassezia restricta CBS 7877]